MGCAFSAATARSPRFIWPTRSKASSRPRPRACRRTGRRRTHTGAAMRLNSSTANRRKEMSAIKLHVIKPSVNNMTARVFVRAAKLDFTEDDVYGKTRSEDFMAKNPAHLTPMMEADHLPKGVMFESCAIMQYLCNKHDIHQFYPTAPAPRAMIDSAMF